MDIGRLVKEAVKAREKSYSPYSKFKVGAALLSANGKIYTGCNVENAAYSPTNCAERTAFFKAVSEGQKKFSAIAIAGGENKLKLCYPCGVCRQVMAEFCDPETFRIIVTEDGSGYKEYLLKEMYPLSFGPGDKDGD